MSFSLDFLNEIKIQEVAKTAPRIAKKANSNPNPEFMGIRIWKSGKVYPSQALTDAFCLEYPTKIVSTDEEGNTVMTLPDVSSNGLDVFALSDWSQIDSQTRQTNKVLLIGVSPKTSAKIDLFGNVRYNQDGTPVSSVMEQGASTFGTDSLIPMIESTYSTQFNEEGYIDLEVNTKFNLKSKAMNGIFMIPKVISRGKDAGKADVVRRENIDVFPLTPVVSLTSVPTPPPAPTAETVTEQDVLIPQTGSDFDLDSQY